MCGGSNPGLTGVRAYYTPLSYSDAKRDSNPCLMASGVLGAPGVSLPVSQLPLLLDCYLRFLPSRTPLKPIHSEVLAPRVQVGTAVVRFLRSLDELAKRQGDRRLRNRCPLLFLDGVLLVGALLVPGLLLYTFKMASLADCGSPSILRVTFHTAESAGGGAWLSRLISIDKYDYGPTVAGRLSVILMPGHEFLLVSVIPAV